MYHEFLGEINNQNSIIKKKPQKPSYLTFHISDTKNLFFKYNFKMKEFVCKCR